MARMDALGQMVRTARTEKMGKMVATEVGEAIVIGDVGAMGVMAEIVISMPHPFLGEWHGAAHF